MPAKNKSKSFVPVDEHMKMLPGGREQIVQVAERYGIELPELHEAKGEIRSKCYLLCGRTKETSDRVLALEADDPTVPWKCFEGGCGKSGNFVGLCDLMKPGENAGGKPRGERFKGIAADIAAMANGENVDAPPALVSKNSSEKTQPSTGYWVNVPLAESENERARELVDLNQKFVVHPGQMNPDGSRFVRMHPFLTEAVCTEARMGLLPRDGGEDKSGGTMRGLWVSGYNDEEGKLLTWFGRHLDYEERVKKWEAAEKKEPKPGLLKFTKGFRAALELYGQDRIGLHQDVVREKVQDLGLIVVSDPLHVHKVRSLGGEAVATCLDAMSREQAVKAARLIRSLDGGKATLLFDGTEEGEQRMRQALGFVSQMIPTQIPVTTKTFGGKFRGKTVAEWKQEEWDADIVPFLRTGNMEGWQFG